MTAPGKTEPKDRTQLRKDVQALDAAELQDRMMHLRDQEREVRRELAELRGHDESISVERQVRDAAREVEDGARHTARAAALTVAALIPPAVRTPTLLVDLTFNAAIAMLAFQRDFLNDVLGANQRTAS